MPPLNLTLTLIVKNKEENLQNCLASFEGLWDELIVVDTGSTDRTKEVAAKFNARIYDFAWINDFSAARNFGLEKVNTTWTMTLDADDIIYPEDKKQLLETLQKLPNEIQLIKLPYYYSGGRFQPGNILEIPRIWQTALNFRFIRPIHEYLDFNPTIKDITINAPVVHNKNSSDFAKSIHRNYQLLQEHIQKNPTDFLTHFYLGRECKSLGDKAQAKEHFQSFLSHPQARQNLEILYYNLIELAQLELLEGQHAPAKKHFEQALQILPGRIEAYIYLAEMELHLFSKTKAIALLHQATQIKVPKKFAIIHSRLYYGVATQLLQLANKKI